MSKQILLARHLASTHTGSHDYSWYTPVLIPCRNRRVHAVRPEMSLPEDTARAFRAYPPLDDRPVKILGVAPSQEPFNAVKCPVIQSLMLARMSMIPTFQGAQSLLCSVVRPWPQENVISGVREEGPMRCGRNRAAVFRPSRQL